MKGCRTIAEFAIRTWMEANGFVMDFFNVKMDGNTALITDRTGDNMKVSYDPVTKSVEIQNE